MSNHWLIVKEHLISLFADDYMFVVQWEGLYMSASTQLFSLDVSSNFGALYNKHKKGSSGFSFILVVAE